MEPVREQPAVGAAYPLWRHCLLPCSDDYIALFSHFISCGDWEAVYILDGLTKNRSDIRPDTLQDSTVFAQPVPVTKYAAGFPRSPTSSPPPQQDPFHGLP